MGWVNRHRKAVQGILNGQRNTTEDCRAFKEMSYLEMSIITYYACKCLSSDASDTPYGIYCCSPTGELFPVYEYYQMALMYFDDDHDGKIIKHPIPNEEHLWGRVYRK